MSLTPQLGVVPQTVYVVGPASESRFPSPQIQELS